MGEWPTLELTLSAHNFGCSLRIRLIEVDCWLVARHDKQIDNFHEPQFLERELHYIVQLV